MKSKNGIILGLVVWQVFCFYLGRIAAGKEPFVRESGWQYSISHRVVPEARTGSEGESSEDKDKDGDDEELLLLLEDEARDRRLAYGE